jgi:hypothetical protein
MYSLPRTALIAAPVALLVVLLTALASSSNDSNPVAAPAVASASSPTGAIATDQNLKVALIGDSANGANFQAVLNLVQSEGADIVMNQGDFDYANDADGWFATINSVLGPTFPYVGSVGNHDIATWPEGCGDTDGCYAAFFKQRMAATGITPDDPNLNDQMYAADFHGLGMFFVGETSSQTGDCPANPSGYACYLRTRLQTDRHIWRICSWHKNQQAMQIGGKTDEMGWGVYDACTDLSAIIATGHEHSYERTLTMTDPQTQTVDLQQHPLSGGVPSNPNSLRVKPGSSFVAVSGLGGNDMRPQLRCLPATYPYGCNHEWANIYTTNQTGGPFKFGALFIEFYVDGDPYKAHAYFKTTTGEVIDSFDIRADFTDTDGDGIQDGIDNCAAVPNPNQVAPSWRLATDDADCDGFPDGVAASGKAPEPYIGTDPAKSCASTGTANDEPTPDAMPPDFNDDRVINGQDTGKYGGPGGAFNNTVAEGPFNGIPGVRFDFSGDGAINGQDTGKFSAYYNKSCASQVMLSEVAWIQPSAEGITRSLTVADYRCDMDDTREVRALGP